MSGLDGVAAGYSDLLKVISHPDRLRLTQVLRDDESDVQGLAGALGLPATRVSQHLTVLRAHGIVDRRRAGRHRLYRLVDPALAGWLMQGLKFLPTDRKGSRRAKSTESAFGGAG